MDGATALIETSRRAGVEVCFANPGTTEMPLVAALDRSGGMRAILGLFEGVCTGAADGYGRMTGRPAATLLHLGPGFANGIANLHNARRARTPLVNWIGDQATWHLAADAPLTSDIASLARPVGFVREVRSAAELPEAGAEAVAAASKAPGGIASLVIPADCQWEPGVEPVPPQPIADRAPVADAVVANAAAALQGEGATLFLGGAALGEAGLRAAARIAEGSGCSVFTETFSARHERGAGLPHFARLPYFPEQGREALAKTRQLVLAGAIDPVAFFAYPGQSSRLMADGARLHTLASPADDVVASLEALAERLGAPGAAQTRESPRPQPATGELTVGSLCQTLAGLQPDGAIVVDEAATSGLPWSELSVGSPRHTVLSLTGGAIGQGLPCAVGAAVACPDRRVIAFQADGSGLYTLQSLWTMARESLDVTVVICANRSYRILQVELARAGVAEPGPTARALTHLEPPVIDWVSLARGFGVPAQCVTSADDFANAFRASLAEPGPSLIEAVLG